MDLHAAAKRKVTKVEVMRLKTMRQLCPLMLAKRMRSTQLLPGANQWIQKQIRKKEKRRHPAGTDT